MLIGDSFAQGAFVPAGSDPASLFREAGVHTVTCGMGANGPLLELATLIEFGSAVRPPVVLWLYYEANDMRDLTIGQRNPLLRRYLDDPAFCQHLWERQGEVDVYLRRCLDARWSEMPTVSPGLAKHRGGTFMGSRLFEMAKLTRLRARLTGVILGAHPELLESPPPSALFGQILDEARTRVAAWEGTVIFVYLPAWSRYASHANDHGGFHHRDAVLAVAREIGMETWDFGEALAAQPDPLAHFPFCACGHYNEDGYALLAAWLLKRLGERISSTQETTGRTGKRLRADTQH